MEKPLLKITFKEPIYFGMHKFKIKYVDAKDATLDCVANIQLIIINIGGKWPMILELDKIESITKIQ